MKKERISLFTLMLILLILSVIYIKLSLEHDKQQNNAEITLKSNLSFATSGFALDFNSISDERQKQYYYNEAMSNTYSSAQLVGLTTYESKNDSLDLALYNLYKLMEQNEYKNKIMDRSKSIYDNFLRLSQDPTNKEATENIIKLTEEIREEK